VSDVTPRLGDKLRVNFDTTAAERSDDPYMVNVIVAGQHGDDRVVAVPSYAVEVLERAVGPRYDLTGTVRQGSNGDIVVRWHAPSDYSWAGITGPENCRDSDVEDWPVIGAVPGTPAAEAQAQDSDTEYRRELADAIHAAQDLSWEDLLFTARRLATHALRDERAERLAAGDPLTVADRQRVADLLVAGDKADAVKLVAAIGMPPVSALSYVESMPEYQTYLNHHSGKRDPRLFRADKEGFVEEPPEDVHAVEDRYGDRLTRDGEGWIGHGGGGYPLVVKPWENHVLPKYTPYIEVSS
jgi:hypothetical protein